MINLLKVHSELPEKTIKSVTFDNIGEFKQFGLLGLKGIKIYFCDPGRPYQKGQVERTNAILHKFIPKKTDFSSITNGQLKDAKDKLNNLPRECLNFLTPDEAYNKISSPVALNSPESSNLFKSQFINFFVIALT